MYHDLPVRRPAPVHLKTAERESDDVPVSLPFPSVFIIRSFVMKADLSEAAALPVTAELHFSGVHMTEIHTVRQEVLQ